MWNVHSFEFSPPAILACSVFIFFIFFVAFFLRFSSVLLTDKYPFGSANSLNNFSVHYLSLRPSLFFRSLKKPYVARPCLHICPFQAAGCDVAATNYCMEAIFLEGIIGVFWIDWITVYYECSRLLSLHDEMWETGKKFQMRWEFLLMSHWYPNWLASGNIWERKMSFMKVDFCLEYFSLMLYAMLSFDWLSNLSLDELTVFEHVAGSRTWSGN